MSHAPVLLAEAMEALALADGGVFIDATFGGGGYSREMLARADCRVIAFDRDPDAIARGVELSESAKGKFTLHQGRFGDLAADELVGGVVFDLGVSSFQLDEAERGFSYRSASQLDMRMDRRQAFSAVDVVNEYPFPQLARVIENYGEERFARRIARAIVDARPIHDTGQLADVVRSAIPAAARRSGGHPAKRTFQAIRMEVNRELDQLAEALDGAMAVLAPGGRMVVMSYHSLEDRMVKQSMRDAATGGCTCPPNLPCVCGAEPTVKLLKRGAWKATEEEIASNRRAESVRIRAVERIAESA